MFFFIFSICYPIRILAEMTRWITVKFWQRKEKKLCYSCSSTISSPFFLLFFPISFLSFRQRRPFITIFELLHFYFVTQSQSIFHSIPFKIKLKTKFRKKSKKISQQIFLFFVVFSWSCVILKLSQLTLKSWQIFPNGIFLFLNNTKRKRENYFLVETKP